MKGIENEQTPIVIHEALFALGTSGNKKALEFIKKYENNENYVISESAKIALDRINLLKNPYSCKKYFEN
jgi:HEAT repeat protein